MVLTKMSSISLAATLISRLLLPSRRAMTHPSRPIRVVRCAELADSARGVRLLLLGRVTMTYLPLLIREAIARSPPDKRVRRAALVD